MEEKEEEGIQTALQRWEEVLNAKEEQIRAQEEELEKKKESKREIYPVQTEEEVEEKLTARDDSRWGRLRSDLLLEAEANAGQNLYGHKWTVREEKVFEMSIYGFSIHRMERELGINRKDIKRILNRDFFQRRMDAHFMVHRKSVEADYLTLGRELIHAVREVLRYPDVGQTANARVTALRDFLTSGPNPIINRKPQSIHNTLNVNGEFSMKKLDSLTQEELLDGLKGGELTADVYKDSTEDEG
jgi:hypothetical protein